jgi:hypothetical protein
MSADLVKYLQQKYKPQKKITISLRIALKRIKKRRMYGANMERYKIKGVVNFSGLNFNKLNRITNGH